MILTLSIAISLKNERLLLCAQHCLLSRKGNTENGNTPRTSPTHSPHQLRTEPRTARLHPPAFPSTTHTSHVCPSQIPNLKFHPPHSHHVRHHVLFAGAGARKKVAPRGCEAAKHAPQGPPASSPAFAVGTLWHSPHTPTTHTHPSLFPKYEKKFSFMKIILAILRIL